MATVLPSAAAAASRAQGAMQAACNYRVQDAGDYDRKVHSVFRAISVLNRYSVNYLLLTAGMFGEHDVKASDYYMCIDGI